MVGDVIDGGAGKGRIGESLHARAPAVRLASERIAAKGPR